MSIRKGSSIIAGNIGQNVDSALSPSSDNPVKNSVIYDAFQNTLQTKNITDCITEIPQDIKLELNNSTGVLTLKAGSKLYYPNGFETDNTTRHFDTLTTTNDLILNVGGSDWTNANHLLFVTNNATSNYGVKNPDHIWSGDTTPTDFGQYAMWYDTINNIIRFTQDSGSTWTTAPISLPVGMVINTNAICTGISQIFNGFGFVGGLSYVLPGVKGLAPNGRNENGTLKSTEITITNILVNDGITPNIRTYDDYLVFTINYLSAIWEEDLILDYYPAVSSTEWALVYDTNKNEYYRTNYGEPYEKLINVNSHVKVIRNNTTGKIENINKGGKPFKSLDCNNTSYITHQSMPSSKYINLTLGASGTTYIAPADGWFYAAGSGTSNNMWIELISNISQGVYGTLSWNYKVSLPVKKGEPCIVSYNDINFSMFRFIYANGSV